MRPWCDSMIGNPLISADHPDEYVWQGMLRLQKDSLSATPELRQLTSWINFLILSRRVIAPLYFSLTFALVVCSFHCFAWIPLFSCKECAKYSDNTDNLKSHYFSLALNWSFLVKLGFTRHWYSIARDFRQRHKTVTTWKLFLCTLGFCHTLEKK